jgi:hypothetical protein
MPMVKIYQKVLEHAKGDLGEDGKRNVEELIDFLNLETKLKFPKNSIAIYTIIRQSYNYYMNKNEIKNAIQIPETYQPAGYVWKVKNKYQ